MAESYDVIVAGLGAMGSATAYHIARRGRRVLGLDRFTPGHTFGSSHGETRMIREIYYEHPLYVPIVRRAYELWRQLEQEAETDVMLIRGGLMIGPPDGRIVSGVRRTAEQHNMPHDVMTARELRARFPAFAPSDENVAVFDPRAGMLRPEACISAHLTLAQRWGAALRFAEPMTSWSPDGDGVRVTTSAGTYHASKLVITAGAWTRGVAGPPELPLQVERQVAVWMEPAAHEEWYDPERCPIYICEYAPGLSVYGFPRFASGVKAALFHGGEIAPSADQVRREVEPEEVRKVQETLARFIPGAASARPMATQTCLFTNTPDTHFLIDFHPAHRSVLVSSPCSGHGFKFASVVGEMQADLVLEGRSRFDLSQFRWSRFTSPTVSHP